MSTDGIWARHVAMRVAAPGGEGQRHVRLAQPQLLPEDLGISHVLPVGRARA